MIDCGATSYGFIDETFAKTRNLDLRPLDHPREARGFDGQPSAHGPMTHYAMIKLRIGEHLERVPVFVTTLKKYDMILGYQWLKLHNPQICWIDETLKFSTSYCRSHCLRYHVPYAHAHDYPNSTRYQLPIPIPRITHETQTS
jgi:hypothetical protein